jgi:hypothetical protein
MGREKGWCVCVCVCVLRSEQRPLLLLLMGSACDVLLLACCCCCCCCCCVLVWLVVATPLWWRCTVGGKTRRAEPRLTLTSDPRQMRRDVAALQLV